MLMFMCNDFEDEDYFPLVFEHYENYEFSVWFESGQYHVAVCENDNDVFHNRFNHKDDAYECLEEVFNELTDEEFPW